MIGRAFVRFAASLTLALSLSGCLFSVQDGDSNVYVIEPDGTVDRSGANADTLNS